MNKKITPLPALWLVNIYFLFLNKLKKICQYLHRKKHNLLSCWHWALIYVLPWYDRALLLFQTVVALKNIIISCLMCAMLICASWIWLKIISVSCSICNKKKQYSILPHLEKAQSCIVKYFPSSLEFYLFPRVATEFETSN